MNRSNQQAELLPVYFGNLPDYDDLEVDFRSALAREVELHRLGGIDELKVPKRFGIEGRTAYARFTLVEDNIKAVRLFDGQRFAGRTLHVKICSIFQREYDRLLRCEPSRREQQREQQREQREQHHDRPSERQHLRPRDEIREQPRREQREQSRDRQLGTLTPAAQNPGPLNLDA